MKNITWKILSFLPQLPIIKYLYLNPVQRENDEGCGRFWIVIGFSFKTIDA